MELLNKYNTKFDFIELGKLAIDYSDGIVEAGNEVNAELLKYATDKNLPLLKYPGKENIGDSYDQFYQQILGDEE
jgi:starch synthase